MGFRLVTNRKIVFWNRENETFGSIDLDLTYDNLSSRILFRAS